MRVTLVAALAVVAGCATADIGATGDDDDDGPIPSSRSCGNGTIDDALEVCDDGNQTSGDGCNANCTSDETCGNGVTDDTEVCDDGNQSSGDGCSDDCASDETCGNGVIDLAKGEVCDDSNTAPGDGCGANCQPESRVYVLDNMSCVVNSCTSTQFFGFTFECSISQGGPPTNPYDQCDGRQTGWKWQDTGTTRPSMVTMEVNNGIACQQYTAVTTINGVSSGSFLLADPAGTGCFCDNQLTERLNTWTFTGAQLDGYQPGALNTLTIAGMPSCFGVSSSEAIAGYVKITVVP
jgi:cysteine-rich repeat protein